MELTPRNSRNLSSSKGFSCGDAIRPRRVKADSLDVVCKTKLPEQLQGNRVKETGTRVIAKSRLRINDYRRYSLLTEK